MTGGAAVTGRREGAMDREELLRVLIALHGPTDPEAAHSDADDALLRYIGDDEIREAYDKIKKWYA